MGMPNPEYLTLGELIEILEGELAKGDRKVPHGFTNPHSYRGYYEQLAFEPTTNVLVSEMLADAKSALGSTYEGWKGGEFTMGKYTEVWLAYEGSTGESIGKVLLHLFLSQYAAQASDSDGKGAVDG